MTMQGVGLFLEGMVAGALFLAFTYGVSRSLGKGGALRGLEPSPGYMRARARSARQKNGQQSSEVKRG